MFKGSNLKHIRILNGMSRKQLAIKTSVTEQAIWQFENGNTTPKLEVVNQFKTIFNVRPLYFYREDLLSKEREVNINVENIAYRSETINSVSKSQSESMHMLFLDSFIHQVEGRVSYPENKLLTLRQHALEIFQYEKGSREEQIKKIAAVARNKLGLSKSNNKNLLFLLEKSGAFIFEKAIDTTIDAYSLWSEDDRAYIILGNMKKSAVRRNFDLAHELGHLLLHYKVEFTMQNKDEYRNLEKEANQFASDFLLPDEVFTREFSLIERKSNPDAYLDLKNKWLVSMQAIAVKAYQLDLISYQQYRYFFISINKKRYKEIEPLDDVLKITRPSKFKSVLQLLIDEGLLSISELINKLHVDEMFLSKLTGIDSTFFEKYLLIEKPIFTKSDLTINR